MLKKKERYEIKITSISGFCGKDYEENLERFRKDLNKKGGYIDGIITISSIVIYREKIKANLVEKID